MDYIELIRAFPKQVKEAIDLAKSVKPGKFNNVLICGMGGSGIIGDIAKDMITDIPIFTCKDYDIPEFVDKNTLVFCISYSGNTEETLSCFDQALKKTKNMICIASNGKLEQLAKKNNIQLVKIPTGIPPRTATGYFMAVLAILGKAAELENAIKNLDLTSLETQAKTISSKIGEKIPIIYSTFPCIGFRWMQEINENAKILCHSGALPEMNHNEINAFTHPNNAHIILIHGKDHPQTTKRFSFLKNQLSSQNTSFSDIVLDGSQTEIIIKGILIGDFTSYFLAKSREIDPFNIDIIENLKKTLV